MTTEIIDQPSLLLDAETLERLSVGLRKIADRPSTNEDAIMVGIRDGVMEFVAVEWVDATPYVSFRSAIQQ